MFEFSIQKAFRFVDDAAPIVVIAQIGHSIRPQFVSAFNLSVAIVGMRFQRIVPFDRCTTCIILIDIVGRTVRPRRSMLLT